MKMIAREDVLCLVKSTYPLAESPLWNRWRKSIIYIDIAGKQVYEYSTENKTIKSIDCQGMLGTVALVDADTIIVAEERKLVQINLETEDREILAVFDLPNTMRFNDGKCDSAGRFVVGTLAIDRSINARYKQGHLYAIDLDGSVKTHLSNLTVSNGMAWDEAKGLMYYTDSYTRKIDTYTYDSQTGEMIYKETQITIPQDYGTPDGLTIDEEGMLWVAIWGGGCVLRINPQDGTVLSHIPLPEKHVTCCIFGGEDMNTLYITTAGDEEGNLGGLYSIQTETRGRETHLCRVEWNKA